MELKSDYKTQKRRRWHRFYVVTPSVAILRGSYSMNDRHFKFGSRGQQGSPCSIVAVVFSRLFEIKSWTSSHIDQILEHGDKLFRISQTRSRLRNGTYMTPSQVHPEFFIDDYKCLTCTKQSGVFGNLVSETVDCPDLMSGLQRFFTLHDAGIVTAQGTSVAIWRHSKNSFFYFDPSSCSETGCRTPDIPGTACLIRFKCLNDMGELFLGNLNLKFDSSYCIDKVDVLKVSLVNREMALENPLLVNNTVLKSINQVDFEEKTLACIKVIPRGAKKPIAGLLSKEPLSITISNYNIDVRFATEPLVDQSLDSGHFYDMEVNIPSPFKKLPGDVAVLHGWTHELKDSYKGKGAQTVANCAMAIAMKKIHPVRTWLRPKIDEILTFGDALYAEVKSAKPIIKSLTAADLDDTKIILDNITQFFDVDLLTVVGTLSSKVPSVLNLKQALDEFFLINKDGILECSSMAVAVWTQDDNFYMFNPSQCDAEGVRILEEKGKTRGKSKRKDGDVVKKVEGKSCVIRFRNLDSLIAHIMKSVDPSKKNDRFIIRHIKVVNNIPGTRVWADFQPGEVGKTWVLLGNLSNESEEFEDENRGIQGIAMPVTALIKAQEVPPNLWAKETIDEAVREGNEYFNWCIPEQEDEELTLRNLKNRLYVQNRKIKINIEEATVVGDLKATTEAQLPNLATGFRRFFIENQMGIVEVKDLSVAVWKFDEEEKQKGKSVKETVKETSYYCFDPNPRGRLGQRDPDDGEASAACVIRALDPAELARRIENNLSPEAEGTDEFFIHKFKIESISEPMTVEDIELDKQTPDKPDLNAYVEVDDGACLNGSFDQSNSLHFKPRTRNKQQAANALVALAMSKLYNPHLWYREVVDDILKLGDKITQGNLENLPEADQEEGESRGEKSQPLREYLTPSEIDETFDIGVNRVTVMIDEGQQTAPAAELANTLREFFVENSGGVLRQDDIMLPLWKEGSMYFTMDPRGRDSNGEPKTDGFATVLWYTNIDSLAASLQKSIAKPEQNIFIDAVVLENEYETRVAENERVRKAGSMEDLWYHFPKKSEGVWELLGTTSTHDERFAEQNRGKQSAAVALMAVIFSKAYEPHLWTSEILDEVIIAGDKLHSKSVARLGHDLALRVNQIIPEFFLSSRRLDLAIKDCVQGGSVVGNGLKMPSLAVGLDNFFRSENSGVVTLLNVNVAIWKFKDHFYSFIPDAPLGNDSTRKAAVLRFQTLDLLTDYISNWVNNEGDYEIHAVDVINWDQSPPWKFDPSPAIRPSNLPPLNAYKPLPGAAKAILRAGIHQGSAIFSESIKNRQTAANCLIALGMSVIKNPITWTKKTLDDILVTGNTVHRESLKHRPSERLKPTDIIRIFRVGVNVLTVDVEHGTVSGQVAVPPPEPEVKGKKSKKAKRPAKTKGKKKLRREAPPPPPPILLHEGLEKFFGGSRAGVLVTGRFMVALWKEQGVYFLFDPRARNAQGLTDEHGVACAMWFGSMGAFFDVIFANIDESEKYGRYDICRVIVRTTILEPLPCPSGFQPFLDCMEPPIPVTWIRKTVTVNVERQTEFHRVDEELSVLCGRSHMKDLRFDLKRRGLQSTAMAAVAIVVSLLHVPSTWTPELIDFVLKYGDILHRDSVRMVRSGDRTLSPSELLTVFLVGDFKAIISIHRHTTAGVLLVQDLAQALNLFFRNNCAGILHTPNLSVAVMQHYGKFYVFEPRECDKSGRAGFDGAACVIKCESIIRIAWLFVNNCNYKFPCVYTLNAVNILSLQFYSDESNRNNCAVTI